MLIGGLDLGTSGCKFTIYMNSQKLAEAACSYPSTHKGREHSINSDLVWSAVSQVIKKACISLPGSDRVRAISVSSFGEAATPIDRNGHALAEARLFWDENAELQTKKLISVLGEDHIYSITGLKPNRKFTINKMAWFRDIHPEIYEKAYKFLLFEDLIIFRMTGECVASYSLAARTMAVDLNKLCWSEEIFDAAGLDMDKMASIQPSGTIAGQVLPAIAEELGLDKRCLLVTGGHDQMCVSLGAGAIHPGRAVNGSGTVEAFSTVLGDPESIANIDLCGYPCCIHVNSSQRFTYGASSTGSVLLEWYIRTFGIASLPEFQGAKSIHTLLEEKSGKTPTNLLFLPYFEGAGMPFNDYNACGVFKGITLSTTRQDIYRALMESIAYDVCINLETLESMGFKIDEIYATGGGSNSPMWLQIKADVTGKPIHQLSTPQAGTQGCMMLAAVAMGLYASIEEAIQDNVHVSRVFEPNPSFHDIYKEKVTQFCSLYHSIKKMDN